MPRYLIKTHYRVNGKNKSRVVGVESRTIKKAKQDGVNEIYNSLTDNQRKTFKINKIDHVRFRPNKI